MKPKNRKPTHPGAYLRIIVLPAVGLSQQEIVNRIHISRNTLSGLLHEKMRLSPEIAAKLGRLLGFDPAILLRMQIACDLWEIEQDGDKLAWIQPIEVAA